MARTGARYNVPLSFDRAFIMSEKIRPPLPEQKNLDLAAKLAREKLAKLDPSLLARRTGAELVSRDGKDILRLRYFNDILEIPLPEGEVLFEDGKPMFLWEAILVLHYLTGEAVGGGSGRLIAFIEIPDGRFYDDAFRRRTRAPLLDAFGDGPEKLAHAGELLGGERTADADIAVCIKAFPEVPVTVVLWRGDEEFPPEGNVLFRDDISSYLSIEDVAVVAGLTVGKLKRAAKESAG